MVQSCPMTPKRLLCLVRLGALVVLMWLGRLVGLV